MSTDAPTPTADGFHPQTKLALGILFSANLLNYVDRQVLYAVLPLIKADLSLSDTQLGGLASAFMLVYMLAAPLVAALSDRTRRVPWIAGGILAWSAATALSGFARTHLHLLLARAAIGVGESSYGALSPSFVADHVPSRARGRALAFFSMAIPVGSALGYIFGGFVGAHFGWRNAFLIAGVAGIPLSLMALRLGDPRRTETKPSPDERRAAYRSLARNRSFVLDALAFAALTFALGGFAVWMPTFFHRQWNLSIGSASAIFGGVTVVSGILGSLAGGWIADAALKRTKQAYFLVSAAGLILSLPFGAVALMAGDFKLAIGALAIAEFLIFLNTGPLNAVINEVTPPAARSMAFAISIFVMHALGDAISPVLIGWVSDRWNLRAALMGANAFLGVAGVLCLAGMTYYSADKEKADAA